MKRLLLELWYRLFYAFPLDTNVEAKLKTTTFKNIKEGYSSTKGVKQFGIKSKRITAFRSRSKISEKMKIGD